MPHSLVEKPHAVAGNPESAAETAHSLIDNVKESVKWRTLAGLFVTFRWGPSRGTYAGKRAHHSISESFLILPVIIFVFFAVSALTLRSKVDYDDFTR